MPGDVDIQLGVLVEFGEGVRVVPVCAGVCVCMYVLAGLVKRLRGLGLRYRASFRIRIRLRLQGQDQADMINTDMIKNTGLIAFTMVSDGNS